MKLGLLTAPFPTWSLEDVADWSAANGFEMLEICCWPSGEGATRRYGGICHIDVDGMTQDRADEVVGDLAARGLGISGLGYYPNPLNPDPAHRETVIGHLMKVISAAALMKVPVVNTFMGADQNKMRIDNWEDAKPIWHPIIDHARDNGVKVTIEHCPMIFSRDEWPGGHNLANSPKIWRMIFEEFDETIGINLDPSHFVWQMIDTERFINEFGERIYHFHAKDLEIDADGLYENGIMSAGMGWQVPRLPGLGDCDWPMIFSALYRVGYDGTVTIEHEDRKFEGTDELIKRGFLLAKQVLEPYIV